MQSARTPPLRGSGVCMCATDPETAEVLLGFFARSPGSDVWVWFATCPTPTRDASWEKYR